MLPFKFTANADPAPKVTLAPAVRIPGLEPGWRVPLTESGADTVPVPLRVSGGRPRPVDEEEMVTLAAALRAIAGLDAEKLDATSDLLIAGSRVSASVTAPKPELIFSERREEEVLQIALEAQRAARRNVRRRK